LQQASYGSFVEGGLPKLGLSNNSSNDVCIFKKMIIVENLIIDGTCSYCATARMVQEWSKSFTWKTIFGFLSLLESLEHNLKEIGFIWDHWELS
jgi:hypothetical protein